MRKLSDNQAEKKVYETLTFENSLPPQNDTEKFGKIRSY